MSVKYQLDGDVFREITANWLCANVKEYIVKARVVDTDQAGNIIENFQLNDGRVFTRQIQTPQFSNANRQYNSGPKIKSLIQKIISPI